MTSEEGVFGAKYFQADADQMSDNNDAVEPNLSWRGDPETTFSDWSIIITTENSEEPPKTYHVHKSVLAASARRCKYFETLFFTQLSETKDSTSRITLGPDEAKAFPIMMDFLYSYNGPLEATTDNAVALRSLARYFDCRELMKAVNVFIQKDLTTDTAVKYLSKSFESNDETLEESARKLIVDKYVSIGPEDLATLPLDLFRSIVCSPDLHSSLHEFVSSDINLYFEKNPGALNARMLNELTSHLSGHVDFEVAEQFMKMIEHMDPNEEDKESLQGLDKFCKLCAKRLAFRWESIDTEKCMKDFAEPMFQGDFRGSGRLIVSRLSAALDRAKGDYKVACQEAKRLWSQLKDTTEELTETRKANAVQASTIDGLKAELELLSPPSPDRMDQYRRLRKRGRTSS